MPSEVQVVPGLGGHAHESNYETSGLYREALLHRALEPGVLGLWGNPVNKVTPAVNFGTATDNAYIILADMWGLIPTFALFGRRSSTRSCSRRACTAGWPRSSRGCRS